MLILLLSITLLQLSAVDCGGGHCCGSNGKCDDWCMYKNAPQYGYCTAEYAPGGPKIHIEPIEAPVATLKENSMAHYAKELGFSVNVLEKSIDFMDFEEKVAKYAGKLAKGLGIMGTIFDAFGTLLKPSPGDIIDAVNKALKQLTDEVNDQFANMKEYVDQSIREAQQESLGNLIHFFGNLLANCMKSEYEQKFIECIDRAEQQIDAADTFFMKFKEDMGKSVFEPADIKRMETEFLSFMDYGMLRTINLLVMYATYKDQGTEEGNLSACRFLYALTVETKKFVDYTNFMYKAIYHGNNNDWEFLDGDQICYDCEDVTKGWAYVSFKCMCKYRFSRMLVQSDDYRCEVRSGVRRDEECPEDDAGCELFPRDTCGDCDTPYGAVKKNAQDMVWHSFTKYQADISASIDNYWQPQTTKHVTLWTEMQSAATTHLLDLKCENPDFSKIKNLSPEKRDQYESMQLSLLNSISANSTKSTKAAKPEL